MAADRHSLSRALGGAAILVIGAAGAAKLTGLAAFAHSLALWNTIPRSAIMPITVGVPTIEVLLAGLWLVGWRRRRTTQLALGFVVVATAMLAVERATGGRAPCGCLGVLAAHASRLDDWEWTMIRNAALGAALAFALAAPAAPGPHAAAPAAARHARAFTLTEVLACIAIIGIIVAFTLPVMGRAKTSAMNAQSAARLSGHARVFALYQQDFHDSFPALTFPEAEFSVIRCETGGFAITARYFHVNALWNVGLADMYYNGNVRDTSFYTPWYAGGPCDECGVASSYYWSCSFLADPTYWNGETREVPPRQLRLTRPAEVRFPAQKSLLSAYLPHTPVVWEDPNMPVHAAFVDGHAQVFEFRAVVPSERSDGWEYADHRYGGHDAPARNRPALMHTPNGVRGIDVR